MYQNIPRELQVLPQWVCAGPDKLPLNPRTGQPASSTDPSTWATFEEALRAGYRHIGFVLSKEDPYAIIDLDDPVTPEQSERHQRILSQIESYAELSQSGKGVHIVVRGSIPHGVRRDKVEIYSDSRYMIFTGHVLKNLPITYQQEAIESLYWLMASTTAAELVQVDGNLTDEQIFEMGLRAANGDKFRALCSGQWEAEYPSQSEADFALLAILGYYTKDNEQVRRMFRATELGKRQKAQRDKYLDYALSKIRSKEPGPVDTSALIAAATASLELGSNGSNTPELPVGEVAATGESEGGDGPLLDDEESRSSVPATKSSIQPPPGFIGELAGYLYASAVRPVPEIATVSALGLCAGVVARSYNISDTGLNQYLMLLAETGTGKDGLMKGVNKVIGVMRTQIPMADQFIGPSVFASGQALIRTLDTRPCFVSVLGEFGMTLRQLCDPKASPADRALKRVLLDLYNKGGFNDVLRESVYSDSEKNTKVVQAPNVTILGESTPDTFYDTLTPQHVAEGLVPRFLVVEYNGPRPHTNKGAGVPMSKDLGDKMATLLTIALQTRQNNTCCPVQVDAECTKLLDDFDHYADDMINKGEDDLTRQIWNRAHLKALKLSALVAVGNNPHQPIVNREAADWALELVLRDTLHMIKKFKSGEVGEGDHRQDVDVRRSFQKYLTLSVEQRRNSYKVPASVVELPLVPYHYIRRRARMLSSFRNDRRGVTVALDACLNDMVKAGILVQVPPQQVATQYGLRTPLYGFGPMWGMD